MTVAELIKKLHTFPQGREIYLATDTEGNGYGKLEDIEDTDEHKIVFYPSHEMSQDL